MGNGTEQTDSPEVLSYAKPHIEEIKPITGRAALGLSTLGVALISVAPVVHDGEGFVYSAASFAFGGLIAGVVVLLKGYRRKAEGVIGLILAIVILMTSCAIKYVVIPRRNRIAIRMAICWGNLRQIHSAVVAYRSIHGEAPASLHAVVAAGVDLSGGDLKCPTADSPRICDYVYYPAADANAPSGALMACDLAGNHTGEGRSVLFATGEIKWLSASEFAAELAKAENAGFARALNKVEAAQP